MKKIILALSMLLAATGMAFAQSSDLQVLAVVKYNKSESITVKQLKTRCAVQEKLTLQKFTLEDRKAVLKNLIDEKLILQAAAKAGLVIPDSQVDEYFMQNMSQSLGYVVTEKQLNDILKSQKNTTLDEEIISQTGMNVAEYKVFLKNNLIIHNYVAQLKQAELEKAVTPTDAEIRLAYEGNKASFVWSDMLKLFAVGVPKGTNADNAKNKANELRNKFVDKKITKDQLLAQSQIEGSGYSAQEALFPKTETGAAQAGLEYESLLGLFDQKTGYVSDVEDNGNLYIFIVLVEKYNAKMLGLSDIVAPDTTTTVYEYIRSLLAQQKLQTYIADSAQQIADDLYKPEYVEEKKTGSALDKLLNWGD